MSLVKKIKEILFEEEEEYVEPVKTPEPIRQEPLKVVEEEKVVPEVKEVSSERDLFRSEKNFQFPDFDEEEFAFNVSRPKPKPNVLEYERKKSVEKRTDYGRYERIETREYTEKKKFKPSPIISPVYGILNQDYKAEDIVSKQDVASNIDIDSVRKKAFEPKEEIENQIDEPVVTFFEEKESIKVTQQNSRENYRTIDDLLEEAADEIVLEDTLDVPMTNHMEEIEEELEKLDAEKKAAKDSLEDTLDNDLFELIDSMYDEREEVE